MYITSRLEKYFKQRREVNVCYIAMWGLDLFILCVQEHCIPSPSVADFLGVCLFGPQYRAGLVSHQSSRPHPSGIPVGHLLPSDSKLPENRKCVYPLSSDALPHIKRLPWDLMMIDLKKRQACHLQHRQKSHRTHKDTLCFILTCHAAHKALHAHHEEELVYPTGANIHQAQSWLRPSTSHT